MILITTLVSIFKCIGPSIYYNSQVPMYLDDLNTIRAKYLSFLNYIIQNYEFLNYLYYLYRLNFYTFKSSKSL